MDMIQLAQRWEEIKQKKYRVTFVSVLTGLFAIGVLNSSISNAISSYQFISASKSVDAKVLSFSSRKISKNSNQTNAQIQYQTEDGKVVQASVILYSHKYIFTAGQAIRIRYRPENPGQPIAEEELQSQRRELLVFGTLGLISLFLTYLGSKGAFDVITQPTNEAKPSHPE